MVGRPVILTLCASLAWAPLPAQSEAGGSIPATTDSGFDRAVGESAVRALASALENDFLIPEVGRTYAAMLRANLAAGAYASFASRAAFADKVSADLQAVHPDGHLRMRVVPPEAKARLAGGDGQPPVESAVVKAGWLADGVAYIRFDGFPGNEATLKDLREFIAAHDTARSLIIDAREHRGGGLAEMDVLFPQLFEKPTVLVEMDTRQAVEEREGSSFAGDRFVRKIPGPAGVVRRQHYVEPANPQSMLAKAKVYLLVSGRTVSAGEHLALSLKRTKRATVIGQTTRGAGHFGGVVPLDDKSTYAAFIPVGRTFDPDTGKGWEGVGIKPDIDVPADKALDEALRLAGVKLGAEEALARLP